MLPVELRGQNGPLLVLLHWLGGGAQTWREVAEGLAGRSVRVAALDLPGFGNAAEQPATDVQHAVDAVIETICVLRRDAGDGPWLIGGHSMGGKIATVVARRALDGEPGLQGLRGLVLTSPSTVVPEPIQESRRTELIDTFGEPTPDPAERRRSAERWIDGNATKLPLPADVRQRTIEGVLASAPAAFKAWFLAGSKEDWSDRVGVLDLPALIVVGSEETSLGKDVQRRDTLRHLPRAQVVVLEGVKHLAPLDRPGEFLEHTTEFLASLDLPLPVAQSGPGAAFDALMRSTRTSPATLETMAGRLGRSQNWNHQPEAFSPTQFRTLRALANLVVPEAGIDLAACIDAQLAANTGDGWRYASLPPDPQAWRRGLLSLDLAAQHAAGVTFLALYPDGQRALLEEIARGQAQLGLTGVLHLGHAAGALPATELKRWFEDVRAELTRFYVSDPRTMERIGYTGFADDLGFTQIQLGQHEEFER